MGRLVIERMSANDCIWPRASISHQVTLGPHSGDTHVRRLGEAGRYDITAQRMPAHQNPYESGRTRLCQFPENRNEGAPEW